MPSDKLRAEWFWVDRWATSSARSLHVAARGLYREMLSLAWVQGGKLPSDHQRLQRLVGISPEDWATYWPQIAGYWDVSEDGQSISNATQLEVLAEAERRAGITEDRARKAAEARWSKSKPDAQAMLKQCSSTAQASPQAVLKQCPPSPSPSQTLESVSSPSAQASQKHSSPTPQPRREAPSPAISRTPEVPAIAKVAPAALGGGEVTAELFAEASSAASESRAEPSPYRGSAPLALPASEVKPGQVAKAPSRSAVQEARRATASELEHIAVCEVFRRWVEQHGLTRAKLDVASKRYRAVLHRLRDGYTVEDLAEAIEGNALSPHHRGENATRTKYHELELICRDTEHVDKFRLIAEQRGREQAPDHIPNAVHVGNGVEVNRTGVARTDASLLALGKFLASKKQSEPMKAEVGGDAAITFRPVEEVRHVG